MLEECKKKNGQRLTMKYYKDNPSEHLKISLDYNTRTTDNQSESRKEFLICNKKHKRLFKTVQISKNAKIIATDNFYIKNYQSVTFTSSVVSKNEEEERKKLLDKKFLTNIPRYNVVFKISNRYVTRFAKVFVSSDHRSNL